MAPGIIVGRVQNGLLEELRSHAVCGRSTLVPLPFFTDSLPNRVLGTVAALAVDGKEKIRGMRVIPIWPLPCFICAYLWLNRLFKLIHRRPRLERPFRMGEGAALRMVRLPGQRSEVRGRRARD